MEPDLRIWAGRWVSYLIFNKGMSLFFNPIGKLGKIVKLGLIHGIWTVYLDIEVSFV